MVIQLSVINRKTLYSRTPLKWPVMETHQEVVVLMKHFIHRKINLVPCRTALLNDVVIR